MKTAHFSGVLVYGGSLREAARLLRLMAPGAVARTLHGTGGVAVACGALVPLPGKNGGWLYSENPDARAAAAAAESYSRSSRTFPSCRAGRFSFAIGLPGGGLLLMTDRFSEAPVYYSLFSWGAAWSDSPPALLRLPGADSRLDPAALGHLLAMRYIPSPMTIHRGVRKMPPAAVLSAGRGGVKVSPYWAAPAAPSGDFRTLEGAARAVREAAVGALEERLAGHKEAACLLSGGIDSSAAAAFCASAGVKLKTFTIAFPGKKSELRAARAVAGAVGSSHTELVCRPPDGEMLTGMMAAYPEPHADQAAVPLWQAARELRGSAAVLLTGDGGDESYGGHQRLKEMLMMALRHKAPELEDLRARIGASEVSHPGATEISNRLETVYRELARIYFCDAGDFKPEDRGRLLRRCAGRGTGPEEALSRFFSKTAGQDWINRLCLADLRSYLPECTLLRARAGAAAAGMRLVSPFLDHRLVEISFQIPGRWRVPEKGLTKLVLRRAAAGLLPAAALARKKEGLGVPADKWFKGPLSSFWRDALLCAGARTAGLFRRAELERLCAENAAGRAGHNLKMWNLLMLELWLRTH